MIQKLFATVVISGALVIPTATFADEASSLLGPASTNSSSTLQPANAADGSALQSSPASNGVSQAPNGNNLQQPATKEQTELFIQGDIDNSPAQSEGLPTWIWVFGLIGAVALVLGFVATRMNRSASSKSTPKSAQPTAKPAATVTEAAPSSASAKKSAAPAKKKSSKPKKRKRKTR